MGGVEKESKSALRGLAGLRVLSLESRRAAEMAKLIAAYGGEAIVAPSMREAPLESHTDALAFARTLAEGGFDVVIFLTGVGTRALTRIVESVYPREKFVELLQGVDVVARGPKPAAALGELGVPVAVTAPEPNTWRELLSAIDDRSDALAVRRANSNLGTAVRTSGEYSPEGEDATLKGGATQTSVGRVLAQTLKGRRVAVQEYGASNAEFLAALAARGAIVTRVPVYEWALPEDVGPLRGAVEKIVRGEIDVALFTTSMQVAHLLKIASQMGREEGARETFGKIVVGSIGPVTSEVLREEGIGVDFEPEHPKMGFLVSEAAQRAAGLLARKRGAS